MHIRTSSATSYRARIEIIGNPLSPATLRGDWSIKSPISPSNPSRVHPASAASVSLHPTSALPEFLVIFAVILIRLPLFKVFEGIAAATLPSPVLLETPVLAEFSLIGVSVASAHSGASSGAVVEHQSLPASIRRLSVQVFFVWVLIFLRLTIRRGLDDREFIIIDIRGLSMEVPLVV
jgi:hypothetical protein